MPTAGQLNPGAYRESNGFLYLLDPRLKLLLLCVAMGCLFSATSGWRLLPLFLLWLAAARFCPKGWQDGLRLLWVLRWLLLFTFLLHLFFTPGRTLLGTSWLSYDGLLRGLLVDGQLLLAILFSMLLAWTTRPERLAWGLTSLLSPLQYLKVPVREAGGLLLLVLQFFPIIQDEIAQLMEEKTVVIRSGLAGLKDRASLIVPLLMRLVDRADLLAMDISTGEGVEADKTLLQDRGLTRFDKAFFSGCLLIIFLLWLV